MSLPGFTDLMMCMLTGSATTLVAAGFLIGIIKTGAFEFNGRSGEYALCFFVANWAEYLRFFSHWMLYFKYVVAVGARIVVACHNPSHFTLIQTSFICITSFMLYHCTQFSRYLPSLAILFAYN